MFPDGSTTTVDVQLIQGDSVQLKVSEWDDLPGTVLAERSLLRCCCRRKRRPEVQELKLADLLGAVLDRETAQLRFVHCPKKRKSGPRVREDVLLRITGGPEALKEVEAWARDVSGQCHAASPTPRKFHVFINPASGNGQAEAKWQVARELFRSLPWISCQEVLTTRAGEARDVAAELSCNSCDGIVVVSGDGMVHEVFNGLASRQDAHDALRIPVGHIPGGSGNAFAKSILHAAGESYGVLDAAFLIAKGRTQPLDLMAVSQPRQPPRTSFLSLSGAIVADIDLGSESLRFLGGLRFPVYTVYCLLNPRPLCAEISYWPATASTSPLDLSSSPPALDQPLPEGPWVTLTDNFSVLWAINMAWAAYDVHLSPGHAMGSGTWHLALLRNAGRGTLTKFMLGLETGSHVNLDQTEILECKAFRLVPARSASNASSSRERFSLDGEEVPFEPIQLWPCPGGQVLGAPSGEELGGVMASL